MRFHPCIQRSAITQNHLQDAVQEGVNESFNCITVDSDTSTSDSVLVFATGKSEYTWGKNSEAFAAALQLVFKDLAHQIVKDGEGATKFVEIEVTGAETGHAAKNIAMESDYNIKISSSDLVEVLGPPKLARDRYENNNVAGVVTGLAWTRVGGDILFIESALSKGKGQLSITGNIGKVTSLITQKLKKLLKWV